MFDRPPGVTEGGSIPGLLPAREHSQDGGLALLRIVYSHSDGEDAVLSSRASDNPEQAAFAS